MSCNSTYRLRYWNAPFSRIHTAAASSCNSTYRLRYWNFFSYDFSLAFYFTRCNSTYRLRYWNPALNCLKVLYSLRCNSTYRLRYWNYSVLTHDASSCHAELQQHLPFTVCAEGCETAEEQSDAEVRPSQVPERSEGKTKVIKS